MTSTPLTDQQLTDDREQEIRTLDLEPLMSDRSAAVISGHLAVLLAEVDRLREAMDQIRHVHKDSPMGPCPVCIDADADRRGEDPTVPYPCPTARLAGAQDCDPPSQRPAEACGKCRQPFDPTDTRFDGKARYYLTPYCRSCVDRCHDTEIADHRCVICA